MKQLILSVILGVFAVAVQAGDSPSCSNAEKAGCCAKAKVSAENKAECPMAKQAKSSCPYANKQEGKQVTKQSNTKQVMQSPKALADAR